MKKPTRSGLKTMAVFVLGALAGVGGSFLLRGGTHTEESSPFTFRLISIVMGPKGQGRRKVVNMDELKHLPGRTFCGADVGDYQLDVVGRSGTLWTFCTQILKEGENPPIPQPETEL
jgi:hypothetical protein